MFGEEDDEDHDDVPDLRGQKKEEWETDMKSLREMPELERKKREKDASNEIKIMSDKDEYGLRRGVGNGGFWRKTSNEQSGGAP